MARSGDDEQAVLLLREADALFRGTALAGLTGGWFGRVREGLEEERRTVILEGTDVEVRVGRHTEIASELRSLLARYPLDEAFIAQQMTALYRCGRQADALNLYQETRRRLDDEQGARPGPDLSRLHQRILRQDPDLAVTPIYRRRGDARQPNTLPPAAAEFIGRGEEIVLLASGHGRAGEPSVKIIEGMPGVGKTALAVKAAYEVAGRLPDAQIYINFGAHDAGRAPLDSADAVHLLLEMLDVPASRIPASPGERAARWRAELTYRRAVIILDDVPGTDQIRPLLPAAGECLILITTRQRLHSLDRAHMLTLSVLPDHDAQALFTQIAGAEQPHDAPAAAEAVRLCGCLPLAIQLAAGRLSRDRGLSLTELVAGLAFFPCRAGPGTRAGAHDPPTPLARLPSLP